jgi:hypothetical protein
MSGWSFANGNPGIAELDDSRNVKINIVAGTLPPITVPPITSNVSSAPAQTIVGTSAGQLLAANPNRKRLSIQNVGTTRIYLNFGDVNPTANAFHVALPAGGSTGDGSSPVFQDIMWTGAIQAISSAPGGLVAVAELT